MRRTPLLATGVLGLALLSSACGAGPTTSAAPAAGAPGSTATSPASPTPSSAAPEVNAAGDIPDTQAFVAYTPAAGGFSVKVPEGWARTDDPGGVTFTDKFNSVRVTTADAPAAPTVASAQAELAALRSSVANYEAGKVSALTRTAGPGVLITYRADSAVNPVTGKVIRLDVERYEFWKAGKQVVLSLSSPQGADNVDPWRTVTDSLRWQ